MGAGRWLGQDEVDHLERAWQRQVVHPAGESLHAHVLASKAHAHVLHATLGTLFGQNGRALALAAGFSGRGMHCVCVGGWGWVGGGSEWLSGCTRC